MFPPQIPAMAKCGDKGSIIINTSALGSRVAASMPTMGLYAATKAGADMLMKYAAIEVSSSFDGGGKRGLGWVVVCSYVGVRRTFRS